MRATKIQLRGQFSIDRGVDEPLSLQIVTQLQRAIEAGRLPPGATLPSSRTLARVLGVSRNTVLTAYDELKSRALIRGRRGAWMRVAAASRSRGFDLQHVVREAQFPSRTIRLTDQDGNQLHVSYDANE
jgi:GntR family transcriptional regulator / MocR family aminotransferase